MTNFPVSTIDRGVSVVEDDGFTLVEEDDVAFTLALCREVHRLYGSYEDDGLPADELIWAGLDLTRQMVLTLQSSVTSGMPSMRLQVAAAQVGEMLAVLFADEPRSKKSGLRGGAIQEIRLDQPALADLPTPVPASVRAALTAPAAPTSPTPTSTAARPASNGIVTVAHQSKTAALWYGLPVVARVMAGIVLCVAGAVMLNVPVVIMALFPNHLTIIGIVYAAIGLRAWQWHPSRLMPWARAGRQEQAAPTLPSW